MNAYADAIDLSIKASGHGHTIATDAIGVLNHILNMHEEKLDTQDKVLKAYLQKTCDLASKGFRLAEKARDNFLDDLTVLKLHLSVGVQQTTGTSHSLVA